MEHIWNFSTVGGVKRVNIESGADLVNLPSLDPKLWTALVCPVKGLEIDNRTLELIDSDNDGQVRVPEIIEAVNWITSVLKNPDDLLKQGPLLLSAINEQTELGKNLLSSAKIILKNLGKENATTITVDETSDVEKIFSTTGFNGDGVITEAASADMGLIKLINEIIQSVGSVIDRSGKPGINTELLQLFFDNCEKYAVWHAKEKADLKGILPFGDATEEAYQNYCVIKAKVDDYFLRCRLAAFDASSTSVLNLQLAQVESITAKNLSECTNEIAAYPLSKIEANKALSLASAINPAWEKSITTFKQLTVSQLLPANDSITELEWKKISQTFAPYAAWKLQKEGAVVEPLGLERIHELLASNEKAQLLNLIEQDKALEQEANNIILVDKLVRYHRDMVMLLRNFVTFFDFYTPGSKAVFQAGTLYIDQRSCDLCIKVNDVAKHSSMVSYSGMFLLYCECRSRSTNEKMNIVAALTNGDIDDLVVGRNALFYDRKGMDWDTSVIKIIDNPISIRQAFFSPYRKVSKFIETQVNKFASAQDEASTSGITKKIEEIPTKAEEAKAKKEPPPPFDVGKFVGIFAAIGLALGAIGTAIASLIGGFVGLVWWKMPFAALGVIILISGPSMVIAYLKLRKRNLAPLLDANGWAINARATVNIPFGNTLTHLAELPKGAKINLNDPFIQKKRPILPAVLFISVIIGALLYVLWKTGFIHIGF